MAFNFFCVENFSSSILQACALHIYLQISFTETMCAYHFSITNIIAFKLGIHVSHWDGLFSLLSVLAKHEPFIKLILTSSLASLVAA